LQTALTTLPNSTVPGTSYLTTTEGGSVKRIFAATALPAASAMAASGLPQQTTLTPVPPVNCNNRGPPQAVSVSLPQNMNPQGLTHMSQGQPSQQHTVVRFHEF
jgi:hypothetical protein